MRVSEGQRLGALTVLIASLFVYIGAFIQERYPFSVRPLPWGDQEPGMIAVAFTGMQGADGIYFFPKAKAAEELDKMTGHKGRGENSGFAEAGRFTGSGLTVSAAGGLLKITEMSSASKLALGLPVDLNLVTEEELSLVPGIGERLARQIVQLRQQRGKFRGLDELTAVPGIKERKLRILKKYLLVEPIP